MTTLTATWQWEDLDDPGVALTSWQINDDIVLVFILGSDDSTVFSTWDISLGGLNYISSNFVPTGFFTGSQTPLTAGPVPGDSYWNTSHSDIISGPSTGGRFGFIGHFNYYTEVADLDNGFVFVDVQEIGVSPTNLQSGTPAEIGGWGFRTINLRFMSGASTEVPAYLNEMMARLVVYGGEVDSGITVTFTDLPNNATPWVSNFLGLTTAACRIDDMDGGGPIDLPSFTGEGYSFNAGAVTKTNDTGAMYFFTPTTAGINSLKLGYNTTDHGDFIHDDTFTVLDEEINVPGAVRFCNADGDDITTCAVGETVEVYFSIVGAYETAQQIVQYLPPDFTVGSAEYGSGLGGPGNTGTSWGSFSGVGSSVTLDFNWVAFDGIRLTGTFGSSGRKPFIFKATSPYFHDGIFVKSLEVTGGSPGALPEFPTLVDKWYESDLVTEKTEATNGDLVYKVEALTAGSSIIGTVSAVSSNLTVNNVYVETQHLNGTRSLTEWTPYPGSSVYSVGSMGEWQVQYGSPRSIDDGIVAFYFHCTYASPGDATISIAFSDEDDTFGFTDTTVSGLLPAANVPPAAVITAPGTGYTGSAISFSSASSSDSDGTIVSYAWNFGDGGTSTQANPTYTYTVPGSYTVSLVVTDNDGATGNDSQGIIIADGTPTAVITASGTATYGVSKPFSATNSTDPNGTIVSYAWTFGDGNNGSGASINHTYTSVGVKTVTLTVTDNHGLIDQDTLNVTVTATNPVAVITAPPTGVRTSPVSFSSASSSGTIASYAWDFGDAGTSSLANPSHAFAAVGVYTVTLTLTDPDGDTSIDTHTITITSDSPTAIITGPTNGLVNIPCGFSSGSSTDPNGSIVSRAWNFGDGGTSSSINPSHTYTAVGTYTITLLVTDNNGNTGTDIHSISVVDLIEPETGMRTPWIVYDPQGVSVEWEVNPKTFRVTKTKKNISSEKTTAGQHLYFEGRAAPVTLSFSGACFTLDQVNQLKTFANTHNQLMLIDDLGIVYWFYISNLNIQRELKRLVPEYHSYSIDAFVLDWS